MKKVPLLTEAAESAKAEKAIFQHDLVLGSDGVAEFQLVVDDWGAEHQLKPSKWLPPLNPNVKETQRRLYPNKPKADLGEAYVCGPDNRGHGLNWQITGTPGTRMRVTLDPTAEGQKAIWWTELLEYIVDAWLGRGGEFWLYIFCWGLCGCFWVFLRGLRGRFFLRLFGCGKS